MAIESIAKTLGSGSGIDITALVSGLVDAQFAAKTAQLDQRGETLTAQISSVSNLKSMITGFDTALKSLITTGSLATQPSSSNTSILKVSALSGASVSNLSSSVEVRQTASAQTASSAPVADKSAAIGTGKLTLTFGTATVEDGAMTAFTAGSATPIEIDISETNSSLTGIRDAINAKNAGVTASILSDSAGSRLVLKSATGASQAFTLTATEDSGAEGLAALDIGVGAAGTTIGSTAQDAIVAIDGVQLARSSNTILDLIPGVRLDLVSASVGTKVSLGTTPPTAALGQAVADVVETYNELYKAVKEAVDPVSGPLRTDSAAKALLRQLSSLTTATLVSGAEAGSPVSLSGIGVATNRDGTLSLDSNRLATTLVSYAGNIESMFKSGTGLSAALSTIATAATDKTYGLGASEVRYTTAQTTLTAEQEKAATAAEALRTRMTRQFATMDAAVASYKATQDFLTAQVEAWNASKS